MCRKRLEPADLAGVAPKQALGVESLLERTQLSGRQCLGIDAGGRFQHGSVASPAECPTQLDVGEFGTHFGGPAANGFQCRAAEERGLRADAKHGGRSGLGNPPKFPCANLTRAAGAILDARSQYLFTAIGLQHQRRHGADAQIVKMIECPIGPAVAHLATGRKHMDHRGARQGDGGSGAGDQIGPRSRGDKTDFVHQIVRIGILEIRDRDDLAIVGTVFEHGQKGRFQRLGGADGGDNDCEPGHGNLSGMVRGPAVEGRLSESRRGERCRRAMIVGLSSIWQVEQSKPGFNHKLAITRRIVSAGIVRQVYYN